MIIRWLMGKWYAHLRRIDLVILWPSCKRIAEESRPPNAEGDSLDYAKAAFAVHAFNDRAWLVLDDAEITRAIDNLT